MSPTESRKPGRPPGAVTTPHALITKDIRETLKLQRDLRDMIRRQMSVANRELEVANLTDRIGALDALAKAMNTLTNSLKEPLKWLLSETQPAQAAAEQDRKKVLESILGKK